MTMIFPKTKVTNFDRLGLKHKMEVTSKNDSNKKNPKLIINIINNHTNKKIYLKIVNYKESTKVCIYFN